VREGDSGFSVRSPQSAPSPPQCTHSFKKIVHLKSQSHLHCRRWGISRGDGRWKIMRWIGGGGRGEAKVTATFAPCMMNGWEANDNSKGMGSMLER